MIDTPAEEGKTAKEGWIAGTEPHSSADLLHTAGSGLPDGHPWKTYPRWRMALHTLLGVTLAGMLGGLTVGFSALPSFAGYASLALIGAIGFGAGLGVICACIAPLLGPVLRRSYPYSQSLLFGAITVVTLFLILLSVASIEWISASGIPGAMAIIVTLGVLSGSGIISAPEKDVSPTQGVAQGEYLQGSGATPVRPGVCSTIDGRGDYVEFAC